jgi:GTP-binding protein LepA
MTIEIITPIDYYGPIMELVTSEARHLQATGISRPHRVQLDFEIPLSEIIIGFLR